VAEQFHADPSTYEALIAREVPAYDRLQVAVASAAAGLHAAGALELGIGTGRTARAVRHAVPGARIVAIDASAEMLVHARSAHPDADLRVARLEDALPAGPFDLVYTALAVHHLDDPSKADLFRRVAAVLRRGGRFVLGDVIVPEDPSDAVTPLDATADRPSSIGDQLTWLAEAGFAAHVAWRERDLAVLVGDRPT
jgi:tRNA (cmo5U34)-methyltransferase